ncbi:STAS domain-containing protein [Polyangium spumosum]|uniref:PAS domain-containing protein n=1 Tax=Polyangium spumosum TaxID=889282 RepID=A0A6N7Q555_9BACT|nr:STAS domain-containing protein [Polyangium spumosum]MRG97404.1 PAS domain-containing protein [Polyangium spumosum]
MDSAWFQHCPGVFLATNPEGAIGGFNPEAERVLGAERVRGGSLFEAMHPDHKANVASAWARMAEGEDFGAACQIRDAAGAYRSFSLSARRAPGGAEIYVTIVPTPRISAGRLVVPPAEDLASLPPTAPERVLRAILDHLDISAYLIDQNCMYVMQDGKGCRTGGFEPGQLVGTSVVDLYGPEQEGVLSIKRALAGEPVRVATEAHDILWESIFLPMQDENGEIPVMLGVTLAKNDVAKALAELRVKMELIERQEEVIRNLETPVIQVWEKVITLPMMGVVDSQRVARVMDDLLATVVRTSARFAILDLTGVDMVDTMTASHIFSLLRAIRLLGAEGIVTGIRPTVAQTMVTLGLDLSSLTTCANLREGLRLCIRRMAEEKRGLATPTQ